MVFCFFLDHLFPVKMAQISVNFNQNLDLKALTYSELCTQQLPVGNGFISESFPGSIDLYKGKPVTLVIREDFQDFLLPLEENLMTANFPIVEAPDFDSENEVQHAFRCNVLSPIRQILNKSFKIKGEKPIVGGGKPDFTLLDLDGLPFLVVEAKPWNSFISRSRIYLEQQQISFQDIATCVETPGGSIDSPRKETEEDGQFHWKLGMRQLKYYLHDMRVKQAFGVLTSYCHSYFVILQRREHDNLFIVSPAVKFCDPDPLKKITEFINKAYHCERINVLSELSVQISPIKTRSGVAYGKQERNSQKRTWNEEEKEVDTKKMSKNNDNNQLCCNRFNITDFIAEGRHGSVFKILNFQNLPFVAKCLPDKCNEDIIREFKNEIFIYEKLKNLQGIVVPKFHFNGRIDGWRDAIIIEQLQAAPISKFDYLTKKDKLAITVSLKQIHNEGIIHGDIRRENIMINQSKAYFVDFALSREGSSEDFKNEMIQLWALLNEL
ncbi:uncharacterized protein [Parasteatoda tepidariorum]|uniref:uncharacterized protein isoform X1 n=1 Tax=Parasteatoda tepidariorum TaxID=114398 RepID=UPI0039BC8C5A